jgi:hypothetical protein
VAAEDESGSGHSSDERLLGILMDAPAAVAVQRGPEHVYEVANATYREFFAGRPLVGLRVREVLPAESSLVQILDRVYATGESIVRREFRFRIDRDGDGFTEDSWFDFLCRPTRDEAGRIDGTVTFGFEVTRQVEARARVEALAAAGHRNLPS